jgi:hypothetical protein
LACSLRSATASTTMEDTHYVSDDFLVRFDLIHEGCMPCV